MDLGQSEQDMQLEDADITSSYCTARDILNGNLDTLDHLTDDEKAAKLRSDLKRLTPLTHEFQIATEKMRMLRDNAAELV